MCARTRLGPGDLPWATFQSHFGSFLAAFELQNGAKIAKKRVQKMRHLLMIFEKVFNQFWSHFWPPKPTPESTQKLDQNWTKKALLGGKAPRTLKVRD